jgi:hypothetical protein
LFKKNIDIGFSNYVTKAECAFYFFLTGFFYLVLGGILMLGLPMPVIISSNGWFSYQSLFSLFIAAQLSFMGIAVYINGDSIVRFIHAGIFLYAGLIILNFFIGALSVNVPVAIFFAMIFSMAGLGIAFFLGLAIDRYYPSAIFSEVRG